jgi:thioredoxin-like negative regulator of GroEL
MESRMLKLLIAVVLANFSGAATRPLDYASAYQESQQTDKPLMVIVSAQWCPACHTLKDTTIRDLEASGQLNEVNVAIVDRDVEPELAGKLMRGQMVPQIIMFSKSNSGRWERSQLTGYQPQGPVRQLIRAAVSAVRRG